MSAPRFKVGDRVRIVASPTDPFGESLAEMAGDVGRVTYVGPLDTWRVSDGYGVSFGAHELEIPVTEVDLQPADAPFEARWSSALHTLAIIRTVLTDPGAGYDMPAPEVAADAIDYAMEAIKLDVDPAVLEAAGYE